MDPLHARGRRLLEEQFVFDLHGHGPGTLPVLPRLLGKIPADVSPSDLAGTGVNGFVISAIGDPNTFRRRRPVDAFRAVLAQIARIKTLIGRAGGIVATTAAGLEAAATAGTPVFVLGIEGADFVERDLSRLEAVYDEGVRVLQLVHYANNTLGSIALPWSRAPAVKPAVRGLSALGREVLRHCGELGLIVDLAHADEPTARDVLEGTASPVLCSHTGPQALQDFPRYVSDELILGIAEGGGLIGMWPFFFHGVGIPSLTVLARYTEHVLATAGEEHVGFGTDINGVPGNAAGYRTLRDYGSIAAALLEVGISAATLERVFGGNFLRLFRATCP